MKPSPIIARLLFTAAALFLFEAPAARADYAVLKSGTRLHITGYEVAGGRVRLSVTGGVLDVAAADLVAVEPEESFPANVSAPPAVGPFADLIRAAAQKHGVEEKLITHVIAAESNFNPRAISRKQAQGLMQLLPKTAARFSVANLFDPAQNIDAGTRYLKELLERYKGNLRFALRCLQRRPRNGRALWRNSAVPRNPELRAQNHHASRAAGNASSAQLNVFLQITLKIGL